MEYVTSRGFVLPGSAEEMGNKFWFNMWRTRLWPYEELVAGDVLYWYESPSRRIVWKTRVSVVERFRYRDKGHAADIMEAKFGNFDKGQPYLVDAPTAGFCLAWKVLPIQRLNIQKPSGVRFPRQGWLRVQGPVVNEWLSGTAAGDDVVLDDMVVAGAALLPTLEDLNRSISQVSPVRIASIVHRTIRRDSALVRALKELCGFRCQFPSCGVTIPKRGGGFYIQVAHIEPVRRGGRSALGNLVVLCPNHHKELDYGEIEIAEQTVEYVRGRLNGREFEIALPAENSKPSQGPWNRAQARSEVETTYASGSFQRPPLRSDPSGSE